MHLHVRLLLKLFAQSKPTFVIYVTQSDHWNVVRTLWDHYIFVIGKKLNARVWPHSQTAGTFGTCFL